MKLTFLPFALVAALLLTACGPSADQATGPTPKETELKQKLADAMSKQAAAEAALAAAKTEAAQNLVFANNEIQTLKDKLTQLQSQLDASAKPVEDTRYLSLKKISIPGTLTAPDPKNRPNDQVRTPSVFQIVFKGVQTGKEYPALEVQESAYASFREGATYTRDELARAKK